MNFDSFSLLLIIAFIEASVLAFVHIYPIPKSDYLVKVDNCIEHCNRVGIENASMTLIPMRINLSCEQACFSMQLVDGMYYDLMEEEAGDKT